MIFLPVYLSLIFHVFTVGIADGQPLPYRPQDKIFLDCGSDGSNESQDQRRWDGDINSKFFPSQGGNNASFSSSIDVQSLGAVDPVPYQSARLSLSEFYYTMPVTPGPKFVRLHFLSDRYESFDISKSFFTVKVGGYTLLNNFSVLLTTEALGKNDLVKEFCVPISNSVLKIMFSPSSSVADAFAFVNGIEVVSMPSNLYYSDVQGDGLEYVGQKFLFMLKNNTAFETMYRVNVGGRDIPPNADTGFFRHWEGLNAEMSHLTTRGKSVIPAEPSVKINFTKAVPDYIAPVSVYLTARTMGVDKNGTLSYNLTWDFSVDSKFDYMVRLHFCEIVPVMNSTGDRVFSIFIANQTAEEHFDVIFRSGGKYVPSFRDYVVYMLGKEGEKKINLSIALQASPEDWRTSYNDAILNGVEIFKLNDGNGNLAGPNPDLILKALTPDPSQRPRKPEKSQTTVIGIVSGVVSGVIVLSIVGFLILRRGRKVKDSVAGDGTTWWGPISFTKTKSSKNRGSSSLPSDLCRYFSLAEIRAATNNFEDIFIIGVGGFGNVYKGYIDNGTTPVAIKRLKPESSQGVHEFKTEIEMLSHLRHRHLVSLIGYCNDSHEMILVYDYMAHGTLRNHLYNAENPPLTWKQRLEICIGAARGLHYLHTGSKYTIIHRDVKTTNILLDEKWVAKVSDFGLSKTGPTSMSKAHVSTVVKGSIGYLDPEYYRRQQLTEKSDVYSFGVVLCEVLCGRPPIVRTAEREQVSLAEWARSCYHSGTLHQIIDPHLTGKIAPECLKKYGEIAMNCMLDNGTERPSMNDVVWGLEFAMQLQQNAEDNDSVGGAIIKLKGEEEVAFINNHNSDGTFSCSWEDTTESRSSGMTKMISSSEQGSTTNESIKGMSGAVFSEIKDPKGR